jgi:hypothetical protein
MAKIDLDSLSIEELASLRDQATEKLAEKVAARQAELEAELDGKLVRKSQPAAPVAKARKSDEKKSDEVKEPVAKAA